MFEGGGDDSEGTGTLKYTMKQTTVVIIRALRRLRVQKPPETSADLSWRGQLISATAGEVLRVRT